MVTARTDESIRILCRTHLVSFNAPRASSVVCEAGQHTLSRDFPFGEYWAYCCDCQHFWQSHLNEGEKASPNCPACDREIRARYLCKDCKALTVEGDLDRFVADKPYSFAGLDRPRPSCPGCLRAVAGPLMRHECELISGEGGDAARVAYTTTLRCCPFCGEATRPAPPPKPAAAGAAASRAKPGEEQTAAASSSSSSFAASPAPEAPAAAAPSVNASPVNASPVNTSSADESPVNAPAAASSPASAAASNGASARFGAGILFGSAEADGAATPGQRRGFWPASGKQWAELIALVSAIFGILAFVFPSTRSDIIWWVRWPLNDGPRVKLNCDKREILVDEQVVLKALADDDYDRASLKFDWLPPEQAKLEKIGPDESQMSLRLLGLKPQSVAVPVEIGVTVTDSYGRSASDKMTFQVTTPEILNANKAPQIAGITPYPRSEVQAGESLILRADVKDPNQRADELLYTWHTTEGQILWDGPTATLSTANVAPMSDRPVELRVTVTADDQLGGINSSTIPVRVYRKLPPQGATAAAPPAAVNNSPRLNSFGPEKNPVQVGEEVRVRASAFDQDGDTLVYGWKVPELGIGSESGNPVFSFKVPEGAAGKQVLVIVEVKDNRGGRVEQQTSVTITPPPPRPQPTAAPAAHPSPTAEKKETPAPRDGAVKN